MTGVTGRKNDRTQISFLEGASCLFWRERESSNNRERTITRSHTHTEKHQSSSSASVGRFQLAADGARSAPFVRKSTCTSLKTDGMLNDNHHRHFSRARQWKGMLNFFPCARWPSEVGGNSFCSHKKKQRQDTCSRSVAKTDPRLAEGRTCSGTLRSVRFFGLDQLKT